MKTRISFATPLCGLGLALAALPASGCELDPCGAFEYAPPSATVRLVEADSGEEICGASPAVFYVAADGGMEESEQKLYPLEMGCAYQFPGWQRTLGASVRRLEVNGYEPLSIELPRPEPDECGILVPPDLEFELTPAP